MRSALSRIPESPQCPSRPDRKNIRFDAAAVVPHQEAKLVGAVFQSTSM